MPKNHPVKLCNGLVTDWANWQLEGGEAFGQLTRVLEALAPSPKEPLVPGPLRKISLGDANAWLTSSVFDLAEPRSIEAEEALKDALELLRSQEPSEEAVERVDGKLRAALGDTDRFWMRWTQFVRDRGTTA